MLRSHGGIVCIQTFGGLVSVEVDPENNKNLIFSFRNPHLAQKVSFTGDVSLATPASFSHSTYTHTIMYSVK